MIIYSKCLCGQNIDAPIDTMVSGNICYNSHGDEKEMDLHLCNKCWQELIRRNNLKLCDSCSEYSADVKEIELSPATDGAMAEVRNYCNHCRGGDE